MPQLGGWSLRGISGGKADPPPPPRRGTLEYALDDLMFGMLQRIKAAMAPEPLPPPPSPPPPGASGEFFATPREVGRGWSEEELRSYQNSNVLAELTQWVQPADRWIEANLLRRKYPADPAILERIRQPLSDLLDQDDDEEATGDRPSLSKQIDAALVDELRQRQRDDERAQRLRQSDEEDARRRAAWRLREQGPIEILEMLEKYERR